MKKSEDLFVKHVKVIEAGRSSVEDYLLRDSSMSEQLKTLPKIIPVIGEPRDVKPHIGFDARFCVRERINSSRL